ncbi:MAG: tetratricopeptide repeat protein [Methanomicrobiales archaeon]|nr:tetratricopeptide repeat protein [Methanomicrobiales archaeon]
MGIFRRLVKGRGERVAVEDRGTDEEEMEREKTDRIIGSTAGRLDSSTPKEETDHEPPLLGDAFRHAPKLKRAEEESAVDIGRVRERLEASESTVREMEQLLKRQYDVIPPGMAGQLRIMLAELRLQLVEAGISLTQAEVDFERMRELSGAAEEKMTAAEERCRGIEQLLSLNRADLAKIAPLWGPLKLHLGRLKVDLATAKMELVRLMVEPEKKSRPRAVTPQLQPLPQTGMDGVKPAETVINLNVPADDSQKRAVTTTSRQETVVPNHNWHPSATTLPERPLIREESATTPKKPLKDAPTIMEPLDEENSPFETGIGRDRTKIKEDSPPDVAPLSQAERERIRIREGEPAAPLPLPSEKKVVIQESERAGVSKERKEEEEKISIRTTDVERTLLVEDLNKCGVELRREGKAEEALVLFDRVLELDPSNIVALHNRGVALRSLGRYAEALKEFERVLGVEPENRVAWFNKAFVLCRLGDLDAGIAAFDRLLGINATHAAAWYSKGRALQVLGRQEEAEECIRRARELGYSGGGG